jgi:uncharacterized protein YfkK (UPF0435 family)
MIDNGFVYAVNKALLNKQKKENKKHERMNKLYQILKKKNKTLVDCKLSDFNKSQLKLIQQVGLIHYLT